MTAAELVERAVVAMRDRISQPLRLDELAQAAGYSTFHFDRMFRSVTGLSAGAFQSALRIEAAKQQLITSDLPVTEICVNLGYESLGSFTSRFTRSVGVSPNKFRAIAQQLSQCDVSALMAKAFDAPRADGPLRGTVHGSQAPDAFVWIGVFRKGMPEERPVSGALRRGDGIFAIPAMTDGTYHVLSASVAADAGWQTYLLSGDHVRVATSGTVAVRGDAFAWPPALELRPLRISDPPILASLALLALN
jgi:AraC family transcriptional regulator